jgi:hypothetical protein
VQRIQVPPLNLAFQCTDIRVTIVEVPHGVTYDLGGTIWGGSQFTFARNGALFFNGRPCARLGDDEREEVMNNSLWIPLWTLTWIAVVAAVVLLLLGVPARAGDPADVERCIKHEGPGSEAMCRACGDYGPDGSCIDPCEDMNAPWCQPPKPKPQVFKPWRMAWQCNDVRVTVTEAKQGVTTFDVGGTVIGGSQFTTVIKMAGHVPVFDLYFNGRPCVQLPPQVVRR